MSPSMSPFSEMSSLISSASVSSCLINEFFLVTRKVGAGGKIGLLCFITGEFIRGIVCVFVVTGGGTAFFGACFTVTGRFLTTAVFLGVTEDTGVGIIHSRMVISSNAKSFPHPPGALLIMTRFNDVSVEGVVKRARYGVQPGVCRRATSPVLNCAMDFP